MKVILTLAGAILITLVFTGLSCSQQKAEITSMENKNTETNNLEVATFGSGCFWCTEAIFEQVNGVEKVVSGYAGGKVKKPTYKEVCSGLTGHAEVVRITYNPVIVSYAELLEIFWQTHDPTTLNRQGADVGTQYRSVIFYHSPEQYEQANYYKNALNQSGAFSNPIITEISPAPEFYPAEDYHQNYYDLNGKAPYCTYVIQPKLEKFKKTFEQKLKKN
jgi:peptide-methionine (S)-S-oxide reductase